MGIEVSAASVRKRARAGLCGASAIRERLLSRKMQNAKRKAATALAFFAVCILQPAFAQFAPALPGYEFDFPRDHGAHEEYKTEWWYYTGHLRTDDGRRYGFELTFFRVGVIPPGEELQSRWDLHNLGLAHFAISDIDGKDFRSYEK